jgi:hypothetical protein
MAALINSAATSRRRRPMGGESDGQPLRFLRILRDCTVPQCGYGTAVCTLRGEDRHDPGQAVPEMAATDLPRQLGRVPPGATHLVVSVGGNDALRRQDVLGAPARSVAEALLALADARDGFARGHRAMLDAMLARRLPSALCTAYDSHFSGPARQRGVAAAFALFHDAIAHADQPSG